MASEKLLSPSRVEEITEHQKCFAHGEYKGNGCPKWPACITDPKIYKPKESGEQVIMGCTHESGIHIFNASGQCQWCKQSSDHLSALSTLQDDVRYWKSCVQGLIDKWSEARAQIEKSENAKTALQERVENLEKERDDANGLVQRARVDVDAIGEELSTLRSSFPERAERITDALFPGLRDALYLDWKEKKAIILNEFPVAEFDKEQK